MKKIIFNTLVSALLMLGSSCSEDYLDLKDPNRASADTYWNMRKITGWPLMQLIPASGCRVISDGGTMPI